MAAAVAVEENQAVQLEAQVAEAMVADKGKMAQMVVRILVLVAEGHLMQQQQLVALE
jgi:hypothetical protein